MENISIKQTRGPAIYSHGELICEVERDASEGVMTLKVWQTEGEAYIAMSRMVYESGDRDVRAGVIEPIENEDGPRLDYWAMQQRVMDHFDWAGRARSMVRSQTDWHTRWRVA
jgi:hypothetical protein